MSAYADCAATRRNRPTQVGKVKGVCESTAAQPLPLSRGCGRALPCARRRHASSVDQAKLDELTRAVEPKVIEWRRDIHQHPELSNRETRTAKLVAEQLKRLGLEVRPASRTPASRAYLKGGLPGPTIALRADMDALPVTEKTDVPFKSAATGTYRGQTVGVMHACGHDVHTAVLMGVAQTLTAMRASLPGNVLFIFQPAEEGAPDGEEGGASVMLKEGLFDKYPPKVVFGLHMWSVLRAGEIGIRAGPFMAASDSWRIEVLGKQAHGSRPWQGIDPIVTAAQIVNGLQTMVSRQVDLTLNPAVVTVGAINAGIRHNIIPDRAEMIGTMRTFDPEQREQIIAGMERIVKNDGRGQRRHGNVQGRCGRQSGAVQQPRADREDGAHAHARGRPGQHAADAAGHGRRRLRVLRAEGAVDVLHGRRDAARQGRGDGARQPLGLLLRRREEHPRRSARDDAAGRRLPFRASVSGSVERPAAGPAGWPGRAARLESARCGVACGVQIQRGRGLT